MSGDGSRRPSLQTNLLPAVDESISPGWRDDVAAQQQQMAQQPPPAVVVVATAPDAASLSVASPRSVMSLSETIASGSDVYQFVPPSCGDECCGLCCPCGSAEVRYASPTSQQDLLYTNSCLVCCSGWEASVGSRAIGGMKHPDCCENGCAYGCCPCLTCSGSATLLNFRSAAGYSRYSIRRRMYCCWGPLEACANVSALALLCFPICWPVIWQVHTALCSCL